MMSLAQIENGIFPNDFVSLELQYKDDPIVLHLLKLAEDSAGDASDACDRIAELTNEADDLEARRGAATEELETLQASFDKMEGEFEDAQEELVLCKSQLADALTEVERLQLALEETSPPPRS